VNSRLALPLALGLLVPAAPAHAFLADRGDEAAIRSGEVAFIAGSEAQDNIINNNGQIRMQNVSGNGLFVVYEEKQQAFNGGGFTANPPCGKINPITGYCPVDGNSIVVVDLGAGNDSLDATSAFFPMRIYGGPGNDQVLSGSLGDDVMEGGSGDDTMHGYLGTDVIRDSSLYGGAGGDDQFKGFQGDDLLDAESGAGGAGSDVMEGDQDIDTVDYSARTAPLNVSIGNAKSATLAGRNDGETGEADDVSTVEIVLGGSAGDVITGTGSANTLEGRAGNDTLSGGGGGDTLLGGGSVPLVGSGDDTLDGGLGNDLYFGGDGNDTATFASRALPVNVSIDDVANDGETGEASEFDNVTSDVENVDGGTGADTLTGSATANRLRGNAGADTLTGLGGDDTLEGGTEGDTLTGGSGEDVLDGGAGDDTLNSRDNGTVDTVSCGEGTDTVNADTTDNVAADCETATRAVPPVGTGPGQPAGPGGPGGSGGPGGTVLGPLLVIKKTAKVDKKGRAPLRITCPASSTGGCAGALTLSGKAGKASFVIAAGRAKTVRVKLSKKARGTIKRKKKLQVTVKATARGAAGVDRVTSVKVLLKR
jgi:Ca2+-binding RTX toxin-like protein